MQKMEKDVWEMLASVYAFMGNSLLTPMTRTSNIGISADFWEEFPEVENEHVRRGLDKLIGYVSQDFESEEKAVERCSVEFTKLFVGPPKPAAPPWETMNRGEGTNVGFGQATYEMRQNLQEVGLELDNENNQYEDHMGIELLYLSVLCALMAKPHSDTEEGISPNIDPEKVLAFIDYHPLSWIEPFRVNVEDAAPKAYFSGLLELAQGFMEWHKEQIELEGSSKTGMES